MLDVLAPIYLFEGLQASHLRLLEPLVEPYACSRDTVIFQQGDRAEYLYILLEGTVALLHKPYDGDALKIAQVQPGSVFGWSAIVGSVRYTSAAVALSEVRALRLRGYELMQLCRHETELGEVLLSRLAQMVGLRWKDAQAQVHALLQNRVGSHRSAKGAKKMGEEASFSKEQHLRGLIENLSAYIEQFHNGKVEFVSFDGKVLKVRLGGACVGCPLSPATLHGWVEGTVHQFFPEVRVEQAE